MATHYLQRLFHRLADAYRHFNEDGGSLMAAAMAYYLALSFFPLLLVLVAGLGVVLESTDTGQDARKELLITIEQQASPALSEQIGRALGAVSASASAGGPIGFVVLLVAAIAIFAQFDKAFDRIWGIRPDPDQGWWRWVQRRLWRRLKAVAMLIGVGAFVLTATVATFVWSAVQSAAEPTVPISKSMQWATSFGINVLLNLVAFTVIYRFVPQPKVHWRDAMRGALVAAVLWETGRQLLAVFLIHRGYPSAYGIIGSFLALTLWADSA